MPTLREILFSLYGTWRLALMEASGLEFFDRSVAGAMRSFFAAILVLPAYILLLYIRLRSDDVSTAWSALFLVEGSAYVISWCSYALIMSEISRFLDCSEKYPGFLCAYNWSSVLQMMVYLPAILISESGVVSPDAGSAIVFVATMIVLTYQWFITRVALDLTAYNALGLVMLDLVLSVFISGAADSLL
ncbi:MAG: hypothetical protein WCF85_04170 [Rhodospirillaceae bacterium]